MSVAWSYDSHSHGFCCMNLEPPHSNTGTEWDRNEHTYKQICCDENLQINETCFLRYAQENDPWGEDYKRGPDADPDFRPKLPANLILDVDKKPAKQGEDEEEIIQEDLRVRGVFLFFFFFLRVRSREYVNACREL